MFTLRIPGYGELEIEHVVFDYNGTLAVDGELLPGVAEALEELARLVTVHVLTADTFGLAAAQLKGVPCRLSILPPETQDKAKSAYVHTLGNAVTACVGNGRNDRLMLAAGRLGIAVLGGEGAAVETLSAADIVVTDILSALGLFTHPLRLTATLRS
ncbi:Soluble P-type ATPase [Humidesulfovibrio mexicanus]|uniref:Soluble P-type ATPase n=1 Tax=Humidesulfovibrio mexicanus TaxID=147047 RepID=A0A239CG95_9BACT|nr:HAD family hydrolase [Humidesulfovibrio mexicanus]SNS19256.1 Soluble P-type ATPase [Humidesulfovibrio mexicanus]